MISAVLYFTNDPSRGKRGEEMEEEKNIP